jgi:TRAP-type C4-dicarboxylate transport system permease small subunit
VTESTGHSGAAAKSLLARADWFGRMVENAALVLTLAAMIILGSTQIVLRNFFDSGFAWADEALRLMVLWVAMLGAVAASREQRHISINVLSRMLPDQAKAWIAIFVDVFTAVVSLILAWYSWVFVAESREFQDRLLNDLPAWIFQSILPVAFILIAYHYVIAFLRQLRDLFSRVKRG